MVLTNLSRCALACCLIILFSAKSGYGMQPPPPPLNIEELHELVSEADVIVVGKVGKVEKIEVVNGKEPKIALDVILNVENVLKGNVSSKTIVIKECYTSFAAPIPNAKDKSPDTNQKAIIGLRAGPSRCHGKYKEGNRIIIFLEKITGKDSYRPLGSGTYDEYLCEFPIGQDGIETLHFIFAEDLAKYAETEQEFIGLIKRLLH